MSFSKGATEFISLSVVFLLLTLGFVD